MTILVIINAPLESRVLNRKVFPPLEGQPGISIYRLLNAGDVLTSPERKRRQGHIWNRRKVWKAFFGADRFLINILNSCSYPLAPAYRINFPGP